MEKKDGRFTPGSEVAGGGGSGGGGPLPRLRIRPLGHARPMSGVRYDPNPVRYLPTQSWGPVTIVAVSLHALLLAIPPPVIHRGRRRRTREEGKW